MSSQRMSNLIVSRIFITV